MKSVSTFIAFALLCLSSCTEAKNKSRKKATSIDQLLVHHTTCFGRCPEYTIQLTRNGTATYTGMRFSDDSCVYQKNIGANKAKEIMQILVTNKYDTCRALYEALITDIPNQNLTIKSGKKTKKISNVRFGPDFLKEAVAMLDEVGKPDNTWKKTGRWDGQMLP